MVTRFPGTSFVIPVWYRRFACHPDIAIWDDISDLVHLPDEDKYVNWPTLWVCEIKIESDFDDDNVWDLDKIKRLNKFKSSLQYGCWLNFNYKVKPDSPNIQWKLVEGSDNIYKTNIFMPDIK
ncbi:MAG: hypothetical protein IPP71_10065 [Bacteroidetes bacterium]|nr:hypothetical protein [Bacteroidota bacterium]